MLQRHVRYFQLLSQIYHILEKERMVCEIDLALRNTALRLQSDKKKERMKNLKHVCILHTFFTFITSAFLQQSIKKFTKLLKYFKNYYKTTKE